MARMERFPPSDNNKSQILRRHQEQVLVPRYVLAFAPAHRLDDGPGADDDAAEAEIFGHQQEGAGLAVSAVVFRDEGMDLRKQECGEVGARAFGGGQAPLPVRHEGNQLDLVLRESDKGYKKVRLEKVIVSPF